MKRLFLVLFLMTYTHVWAQTVSYSYKPLSAHGCSVEYSAVWQDEEPYIVVTVSSERLVYNDKPSLILKLFNENIIRLEGKVLNSSTNSGGVVIGNIILPITQLRAIAQFPITREQIDELEVGVAKVRISTIPLPHERTFKKDKIGKKLYAFFQTGTDSENNF